VASNVVQVVILQGDVFNFMNLFSLILVVLCVGGLAYFIGAKRLSCKRARFKDRENLTCEEIYNRYFSNSGLPREKVIALWMQIAKELKLESGRLRPTDRFDKELSPVLNNEDELADLEDLIHFDFKDRREEVKKVKPKDLNELIRTLLHE
jgi:hypothetical protein